MALPHGRNMKEKCHQNHTRIIVISHYQMAKKPFQGRIGPIEGHHALGH